MCWRNLRGKGKSIEKEIVKNQVLKAFEDVNGEHIKDIVIAYEPIWL